jgi:hypothetical protein
MKDRPISPLATQPMTTVKTRKKITPTPRRLIPIYCSGFSRPGTSGSTQLSIQPTKVQISQTVSPMGAITTTPARKLFRSPVKRPRFGCGNGGGRSGRLTLCGPLG